MDVGKKTFLDKPDTTTAERSALFSSAQKETEDSTQLNPMPVRSAEFTFTNPLFSYENNTSAWLSLTDAIGKLDDYLGDTKGLDKHPLYRAASLLYSAGTSSIIGHYSHEMGHLQPQYDLGKRGDLTFTKDSFWGMLEKPEFDIGGGFRDRRTLILAQASGLNQQVFNLQKLSTRVVRHGELPPDLAISYFLNAAFPLYYTLFAGDPVKAEIYGPTGINHLNCYRNCDFDPIAYRININPNALHEVVSYKAYLGWQLGAFALNGRVADSIVALAHYIHTGKRDASALSLSAGSTRFYLPEVNLFHHPDGLFLTVDEPIRGLLQKNDGIVAHFGVGVAGYLNAASLGVEYNGLKTHPHWAAPEITAGYTATAWYSGARSPIAYRDEQTEFYNRSFGHSAKLALSWHLPFGAAIEVGNKFSYQDPIESDIKLRGEIQMKPIDNSDAHRAASWWYSTVSYQY